MILVQKWPFFQLFFPRQYRPGKCLLPYSRAKKSAFLGYQKQEDQKVEKLTFFQWGLTMVLVQKWPFFQLFFLGNIGQENVYYNILERKNAFLSYKNKKFNKSKN